MQQPSNANGVPSNGWFKVDNGMIDLIQEIGCLAFTVYCILKMHYGSTGDCFPSVDSLAKRVGTTPRSIRRATAKLIESGLVVSENRYNKDGWQTSNYYVPLYPPFTGGHQSTTQAVIPPVYGLTQAPGPVVLSCPPGPGAGVLPGVTPEHHEQDAINKTQSTRRNEQDNPSCRTCRFNEEDLATAEWMLSKVVEIGCSIKPSLKSWANDIRLMRERDNRTDEEIRSLFSWANADGFWKTNILCPSKLRKQWGQLTVKKKGEQNGKSRQHDPVAAGRCTRTAT